MNFYAYYVYVYVYMSHISKTHDKTKALSPVGTKK